MRGFRVEYNAVITVLLLLLCEILVEQRNSLDTLIELVKAEALVGRVDSILCQAEADKQRLDAQNLLKTADNRNRATRVEG